MPMSDLVLSSTVLSSTRFMNWSNPRSVPVTCRLALSATAEGDAGTSQVKVRGRYATRGLGSPCRGRTYSSRSDGVLGLEQGQRQLEGYPRGGGGGGGGKGGE